MAVETVQLKVSGLMCSFCTMSVEKALKRYPGVLPITGAFPRNAAWSPDGAQIAFQHT